MISCHESSAITIKTITMPERGSDASWNILERPENLFFIFKAWNKVLEIALRPGKYWKFELKVFEFYVKCISQKLLGFPYIAAMLLLLPVIIIFAPIWLIFLCNMSD